MMMTSRRCLVLAALCVLTSPLAAQSAPWLVGVASESGDHISWLAPTAGGGLELVRTVPTDPRPPERDGPHNVTVSPDQKSYYVSVAHGTPDGALWRFDAATHALVGVAAAQAYPTTIAITPDGELAFVANSDFFGDRPVINTVTVVHTPTMTTITHIPACDMPHGVKAAPDGRTVWVSCMHSDELLAIDVATLRVRDRIAVGGGGDHAAHVGHGAPIPGSAPAARAAACSPTFVSLSADGTRLYVACNARGTLQVWDAADRVMEREIAVGAGAYNVEPSPDGHWLLVTNKKAQSVSLVSTDTWSETARIATTRPVVHGVAWAPDSRTAYVSQESIGAVPGAVDVIDVASRTRTASITVPGQPTGITLLRTR